MEKDRFEKGTKLKKQNQFKAAIECFEQALEYSQDMNIYFEIADCYLSLFQPSKAIKTAQKAAEIFNNEYEPFYKLAQTYISAEKYEQARELINQKLMTRFPGREENYSILGVVLAKLGKYEEAISRLFKSLELNPENLDSKVALGRIYYNLQKYDKSKEVFLNVVGSDLSNEQAHLYLGLMHSMDGENEKAISEFKYIIEKINSRSIDAYFNLGLSYSIIGWTQEAIASYLEVFNIKPNHAPSRYAIAYVYYQQKDFDKALKQVNAGLSMTNQNDDLFWLKGEISFKLGRYRDALFNYEQSISVNPENVKVYSCLGKTYYELGLKDLAVEYYLVGISKEPTNNDNYLAVARIYEELKAFDLAVKYYNLTVERNENLINGYIGLGYCHKQMNQYDKALGYFDKVRSMNENVPEIHFQIADINKMKEEFEGAVEHYTESLNLKPNNPKAYYEIGQIYKRKNDLANASLYFKEALTIDPQDSKSHCAMGEILVLEKKYKEAEVKLKTALRFDNQNARAIEALLNCYKAQRKYGNAKKALERFMKKLESQEQLDKFKAELDGIKKMTQTPIGKFFAKVFG